MSRLTWLSTFVKIVILCWIVNEGVVYFCGDVCVKFLLRIEIFFLQNSNTYLSENIFRFSKFIVPQLINFHGLIINNIFKI